MMDERLSATWQASWTARLSSRRRGALTTAPYRPPAIQPSYSTCCAQRMKRITGWARSIPTSNISMDCDGKIRSATQCAALLILLLELWFLACRRGGAGDRVRLVIGFNEVLRDVHSLVN